MKMSIKKDLAIRFMQEWLKVTRNSGFHVAYFFECLSRSEAYRLLCRIDAEHGNPTIIVNRRIAKYAMRLGMEFDSLSFNIWLDENGWRDYGRKFHEQNRKAKVQETEGTRSEVETQSPQKAESPT